MYWCVQAAHVRKSSYVAKGHVYNPESHHGCTVHAGTQVQQVSYMQSPMHLSRKLDSRVYVKLSQDCVKGNPRVR